MNDRGFLSVYKFRVCKVALHTRFYKFRVLVRPTFYKFRVLHFPSVVLGKNVFQ
jgi:hypothetical protein